MSPENPDGSGDGKSQVFARAGALRYEKLTAEREEASLRRDENPACLGRVSSNLINQTLNLISQACTSTLG